MSSKPIYPHVPYFYVIQHVASGKKYAGCRFAKGCHPSEFMTEDGYKTSSKKIKKIIKEEGIDAFVVVEIKTIDEIGNVHDYETNFLVENNCAASSEWFNMHNNKRPAFGSEEFKNILRDRYDVENVSHHPAFIESIRQTNQARHGVDCTLQLPEVMEMAKKTCQERWGVDHPMQAKEVKATVRQTMNDRYGVENPMHNPESHDRFRQTMTERYGTEFPQQAQEIREKTKQTNMERRGFGSVLQCPVVRAKATSTLMDRYGVDHQMKSPEIQAKSRQTNMESRGVETALLCPIVREKAKDTMRERYGVENASHSPIIIDRIRTSRHKNTEDKITNEILRGDFGRFEYLWDTVDEVFLIGVMKSLNRTYGEGRYISIKSGKLGREGYVDVLTNKTYYVVQSMFSKPLPVNFVLKGSSFPE
jgi:hypothetical protein